MKYQVPNGAALDERRRFVLKKQFGRRILSFLMASCICLGLLPSITPAVHAEGTSPQRTDIAVTTYTISSYKEDGSGILMNVALNPSNNTGQPFITMEEPKASGSSARYQYQGSNGFASVTAQAEPSGAEGVTDVEDAAYWKTPDISFVTGGNFTKEGTITNVVNGTVNSTSNSTLFAPNSITRMFTEDIIDNTTGARAPDGKPDVVGLVGKAPGQSDIEITLRVKLQKNSVTGVVNMARYTIEATNTSTTQAYAYGLSWNVDTWIGNSDRAEFQAPGVNRFSTQSISYCFPNPGTEPWGSNQTDPLAFVDSIPRYLYAVDPSSDFVATIYPKLVGSESAYPGVRFEDPDYVGMGGFANIMSTSHVAHYYWKTFNGAQSGSADSGHIVRYNPGLLLPKQSLYYGIDYGQGAVGQAADSDPYLQVDMWTDALQANAQKTGYDEKITPNVTYGNASGTNFSNAKIQIILDNRYLQPANEMIAGGWSKTGTDGTLETWELALGALAANAADLSLSSAKSVVLEGTPVYGADVQTDVIFKLVTEPVHSGDTSLMEVILSTTLEECVPLTLNGIVWRDVNNNGELDSFEGRRGLPVLLFNESKDQISTTDSGAGGIVTGPSGIISNEMQYVGLGTLTGDNERYTPAGITLKVNEADYTSYLEAGLNDTDNDSVFEHLGIDQIQGQAVIAYKVRNGVEGRLEYSFELKDKAVLHIRPYAPGNNQLSAAYSDATKVEGGSYSLTVNNASMGNQVDITPGSVPVVQNVAAKSNVSVSYTTPLGYRHPDGSLIKLRTERNVTAWYPSNTIVPLDFPLFKGDVRLSGISSANDNIQVIATDQETICSSVTGLSVSQWQGKSAQLDIREWGADGQENVSPSRENYSWSIVDDPAGILRSLNPTTGNVVFSGITGTAKVRVTSNTMSGMYHEMEITVGQEPVVAYTHLYLSDKNDSSLNHLEHTWVAKGYGRDVYVIGVTAEGTKEKIPNTSSYISFIYENTGQFSVTPAQGNDADLFRITGTETGLSGVAPSYNNTAGLSTHVLVTAQPITSTTSLDIQPDSLDGTIGSNLPVEYWLRFGGGGSHDHKIPGQAVNTSFRTGTVASLSSNNETLTMNTLGNDNLTAVLLSDTSKTDSAMVTCRSSGGGVEPGNIVLGIVEKTPVSRNGYIEVGTDAEYAAYIDTNGNGTCDSNETILGYAEVRWTSQNAKVTTAVGSNIEQVKVTGVGTGPDKLTVAYTVDGRTYAASTDILVYSAGTTFNRLEISPKATTILVGGSRTFTVKAVFTDSAGSGEMSYTLPDGMFTAWTALANSYSDRDNSIAALLPDSNKTVTGIAQGQALYVVYAAGLNATETAKILVVPSGAALEVTCPVWIALGEQEIVTYTLTGTDLTLTQAELLNYITASIEARSISDFGENSGVLVGRSEGRTTLTASLDGLPTVSAESRIYVYNGSLQENVIKFNPDLLNLNAGAQGFTQVNLMNGSGIAVAIVDLEDLTFDSSELDTSIATIPSIPSGTNLTVTAGNVSNHANTTVKASIPHKAVASATLQIHVSGSDVTQVAGLNAVPGIIELWPGDSKNVTVINTGTNQQLNSTMLGLAQKEFEDGGTNNEVSIDTLNNQLTLRQKENTTAGVNRLTISIDGNETELVIVNFTEDPYDGAHAMTLKILPDPAVMYVGGAAQDVLVQLILSNNNGDQLDTIDMPADLLTWRANTQSGLPGNISIAESQTVGQTLGLTGNTAGASAYEVAYSNGSGSTVSSKANAFVFMQDPVNIRTFNFTPDEVSLYVNQSAGIQGVITYQDGAKQMVRARELPYAVPDLAITGDTTVASISANGVIKGLRTDENGSDAHSRASGTLITTNHQDDVDIVVQGHPQNVPSHTVTYISNGGSGNMLDNNSPYMSGSDVSVMENEFNPPAGKIFDGWNTAADGSGIPYVPGEVFTILADTTLYAQWELVPVTFTVTYSANHGTAEMTIADPNSPYIDGSTVVVLPNSFSGPNGKLFDKWNTAADGSGTNYEVGDSFRITSNVTLYAQWTDPQLPATQFAVIYKANGGSGVMIDSESPYASGSSATVLSNAFDAPAGKAFVAWNTEADGSGRRYAPGDTITITETIRLYAQWADSTIPAGTFTVAYNANSGSGTMVDSASPYQSGATVTTLSNAFTAPSGKTFNGWNTQPDGSGTHYSVGQTFVINSDVTLYAQWTDSNIPAGTFTVAYNANGGSGTMVDSASPYQSGATVITLSNAFTAPSGKTFNGWNTRPDGSGTHYSAGQPLVINNSLILYAQWRALGGGSGGSPGGGSSSTPSKYTLSYETNGGTTYSSETYRPGYNVKLDKVPTRPGYEFDGWFTERGLINKVTQITMNGNKTVYARWKAVEESKLQIPAMLNGDTHIAYIAGYPDGTVGPNNSITRGEVAMIFYRLLKDEVRRENETNTNTFDDVTADMWCNKAISTIARIGIVAGRSAKVFDPNAPITRAEFATICARFDTSSVTQSVAFSDIAGNWAEQFITHAAALGWVRGYSDGTFRPNNTITRAEAMCMINRVLGRLPETNADLLPGMKTWPDVQSDAWYYLHVQEATNSHNYVRKPDGVHEHWTEMIANNMP